MAAGIYNLELEQGASFQVEVNIDGTPDFDTAFATSVSTGAPLSYIATVRDKYSDTTESAKFTVVLSEADDADNVQINTVNLSLTDIQTAAISSGTQYWDLLQTDVTPNPDERKRILQGSVLITPQVTRSDD